MQECHSTCQAITKSKVGSARGAGSKRIHKEDRSYGCRPRGATLQFQQQLQEVLWLISHFTKTLLTMQGLKRQTWSVWSLAIVLIVRGRNPLLCLPNVFFTCWLRALRPRAVRMLHRWRRLWDMSRRGKIETWIGVGRTINRMDNQLLLCG